MGELLAGALLAVLGTQVRGDPGARCGRRWPGPGSPSSSSACFRFDEAMPWPGTAVLVPVLATMAVIVGGSAPAWRGRRRGPSATPVLQWIGRHSYALYLWHWPVLVLADGRAAARSAGTRRVVAIGLAVGLAALSLRLVEDPVRHARWLAAPRAQPGPRRAMVLVVLSAGWALARSIPPLDGGVAAAAPQLLAAPVAAPRRRSPTGRHRPPPRRRVRVAAPVAVAATVHGPHAVPPTASPADDAGAAGRRRCRRAAELAALVASMQQVLTTASGAGAAAVEPATRRSAQARDRALPYTQGCVNVGVNPRLQPCEFGVAGAAATILLYGDSHAVQWFEPLQQIALQRGYRLVVLAKGGCPVADVVVRTPVLRRTCPPYRDRAIEWIAEHQPAVVVVSNSYTQYEDDAATWAAGAEATMARLAAVAPHLVVIGDNPASRADPPSCLSGHRDDVTACATARADAVRPDRISGEVARRPRPRRHVRRRHRLVLHRRRPARPSSATSSSCATRPTSRRRWPSSRRRCSTPPWRPSSPPSADRADGWPERCGVVSGRRA